MRILRDLVTLIKELLWDWPLGTVIGVLVLATLLVLCGFAVRGVFIAVDSWFLPQSRAEGYVVEKTFTPAHTQMILVYNATTKTSLPHYIFHPNEWRLVIDVAGQEDSVSVSEEFFDSLSENSPVLTEYVSGRLSKDLYIQKVSHP